MINIKIPNNNISERKFIIDFIFGDYLGLEYYITVDELNIDYSILLGESELLIRDCFFNNYLQPLSYLKKGAIPEKVHYVKNEFTTENDIPVIFGSDTISVNNKRIICGIDIFASSFFMLTRWEEYLIEGRDEHDRFKGSESLAFKSGFLHRPIVNEYVEMLWKMMLKSGFDCARQQRDFELVLTHDVDELEFPKSYRILAGDLIKRKSVRLLWKHFIYMFISNPYDTFDILMSASESLGIKSRFYFMSSDKNQLPPEHRYDLNSKLFKSKIRDIKKRGHIIGFHPGYYSYKNDIRWSNEKKILEEAVDEEIIEGRQHFLLLDIPYTFLLWERNNMRLDSTLGYYDKEGFRCGTGDSFKIYNFIDQRTLSLKERPLIIMDGTLYDYQKYSLEKSLTILENYLQLGRKYKTPITLLFHNNGFNTKWEGNCSHLYRRLLNLKSGK